MDSSALPALFGFLCAIHDGAGGRTESEFNRLAGCEPTLVASTRSYQASLAIPPRDKVGHDPSGAVTVVLHGEIYNSADNQAAWLAQRFAEHGFSWADQIHGSFALVAIDKARDRVAVITDRLNSRRIFASQSNGGVCITDDLSAHFRKSIELDPGGVAWYLTNRIVGNARTFVRGTSVLKRACIHEMSPNGLQAIRYWSYEFGSPGTRLSRQQATQELRTRLIRAVERRLYDNPDVFLSLSAGYDATGLLGILAYGLHVGGVRCFSYEHGSPSPNSDAALAKQMANLADFSHETVESYDGDFVRHLRDSAVRLRTSQSLYCPELGAWHRMERRFQSVKRPVVFVGDECLGWRNYRLRNPWDVLASLQIFDTSAISWLLPLLPHDSRLKFVEALGSDLDQLCDVARQNAHGNWHNAKDYLYLDQRLGNLILPWREACVSDATAVRSPLLDNDVLDFVATLPVQYRLNKRLYRTVITAMFPQLFAVARSSGTANFYLDLAKEFAANASDVRLLIRADSSPLDKLVPPDLLEHVLGDVVEGKLKATPDNRATSDRVTRMLVDRALGRVFRPEPPRPSAKPADVLLRLILLRTALVNVDDR
jgi:asparagine synthetase B (glutamine-hydrolysing)